MKISTSATRRAALAVIGGAALLALAVGGVSPASAAEPPYLGQDGSTKVIPGAVMSPTSTGPQGQLERGINGSFYSALWTGSGAQATHIYRYFEDGTAPFSWDTNAAAGVSGTVLSISTDADGRVYSLHRTGQLPADVTIATWSPEGVLQSTATASIPGATGGQVSGLAVSADGATAYLRVDAATPDAINGIWKTGIAGGVATPVVQGLARTANASQSGFLQVDRATGAIGFAVDLSIIGLIADPVGAPSTITEFPAASSFDSLRGLDMTDYAAGKLYASIGTSVQEIDVASGSMTRILSSGQIGYFTPYGVRWGDDGRLYISGFTPWGVMPVEFMPLKSPEISYPQSTVDTNLCAPAALSLTPTLVGTPAPTWVGVNAGGALPDGVTLEETTGVLSGSPTAEGTVTTELRAANGVTRAWNSEPDTTELTFETTRTPVAFAASPAPVISGIAKPGKTLTAEVPAWDPAAAFTFQWLRDGAPITDATEASYTLTDADATTKVTVAVTGTADCRIAATVEATAVDVADVTTPSGPGPTTPKPPVTDGQGGPLANSGGSAPAAWLFVAAAAVGAGGIALIVRSRRRK